MAELTGVRKSAILLLSLSQDEAAEILKRLPPEAVEEVSQLHHMAVGVEDASLAHIGRRRCRLHPVHRAHLSHG